MHKREKKEYRENKERQVGNYEDNKGREREENVRGGRITNDRISEEKGKKPRWGGGDSEESKIRDERGRVNTSRTEDTKGDQRGTETKMRKMTEDERKEEKREWEEGEKREEKQDGN